MELAEVVRIAGSVRAFRPDPVPLDAVYALVDAARFTPDRCDRQGWRVVVVTEPERRAALGDLFREGWYEHHAPAPAPGAVRRPNEFAEHVHEAPVHLVVLVDSRVLTTTVPAVKDPAGGVSACPFVQDIVLGVRDRGLDTTVSTVIVTVEDKVRALLEVPDGWHVAAHLPIGWPWARVPRPRLDEFATTHH